VSFVLLAGAGVRGPEGIDAFGEEGFERLPVRASGDTIDPGAFNAPGGVTFHEGITVELAGTVLQEFVYETAAWFSTRRDEPRWTR